MHWTDTLRNHSEEEVAMAESCQETVSPRIFCTARFKTALESRPFMAIPRRVQKWYEVIQHQCRKLGGARRALSNLEGVLGAALHEATSIQGMEAKQKRRK